MKMKRAGITAFAIGAISAAMLGGAGVASADDAPPPGANIWRTADLGAVNAYPGAASAADKVGDVFASPSATSAITTVSLDDGHLSTPTAVGGGNACANVASNQKGYNC
jgi:hypothetical protein